MRRLLKKPPVITVTSEEVDRWLDADARNRAAELILCYALVDVYLSLTVQVNDMPADSTYNVVRHDNDKVLVIATMVDVDDVPESPHFYFAVELDSKANVWRRVGHVIIGTHDEDMRQVYCEIMSK